MTSAATVSINLATKILFVEANPVDQTAFTTKLSALPYDYQVVDSLDGAKNILDSQSFDVVILSYQSEDSQFFQLLELIKVQEHPWIIVTESGNEDIIAQLMDQGAYGYLIKDTNWHYLKILPALVTKILAHKRASEKKFSTIFRVSPDSITISSIIGNEYIFNDINDKFTEITGYSYAEAIGKSPADLNLWVDPEANNQFLSILQEQRSIDNFEAQIRHKSGQILTLLISAELFNLNEKEDLLIISKDISELKAARESLRQLNQELEIRVEERTADLMESQRKYQESQERNLDILNALPDLLLRLKRDGTCLDCILPSSPGAGSFVPIKHHISELLSPPILAQQLKSLEAALTTNEIQIYEYEVQRLDKLVHYNVQISPYGRYEVLVMVRDVSIRRQAQEAVLESKQFLGIILDSFPLVVFWKDRNSVYLGCNLNCARACGFTSTAEVIGKTDYELPWTKEESDAYRADDRQVMESGQAKLGIIEIQRRADGSVIWLETNKIPLRNIKGEIVGILGTSQDITERRQAETLLRETNQQLALANEELQRVTRYKDEFLANMSHELRTPLNAILGMSEGLQDQIFGVINKQQGQALKTIQLSSSHLLQLINEILDLAKIGTGQIKLNYSKAVISQLCQSSLTFVQEQARKKDLSIEVSIQSSLPEILVDERRIRQVLINLLDNAVKFTPIAGKITLAVSHQVHPDQGSSDLRECIRFVVIDTGIGIKPENINKLFQPFVQIDTALNRQYTGTGLGLSLVKRIVEIHGGRVRVESQEGVGSCFTIELPLQSPSLSTQAVPLGQPTQYENAEIASHLILLVEDNEATINTISSYLKAKGYRMILAKNGQEAIEAIKIQIPDLILMDIQMSGMDGLEATKLIRRDSKLVNVPIIALTALAMQGDRERCLEAGANEYLTKPVKLSLLAITIGQFLTAKDQK